MERHPTDFAALIFGLVFVATGGGFLARELSGRSFDAAWAVAVASITIGSAVLATTLFHRRTPAGAEAEAAEDTARADTDGDVEPERY